MRLFPRAQYRQADKGQCQVEDGDADKKAECVAHTLFFGPLRGTQSQRIFQVSIITPKK